MTNEPTRRGDDEPVINMGWQEEAFATIRKRLETEIAELRAANEQLRSGQTVLRTVISGLQDQITRDVEGLPEVTCPSCFAVIRARMADQEG